MKNEYDVKEKVGKVLEYDDVLLPLEYVGAGMDYTDVFYTRRRIYKINVDGEKMEFETPIFDVLTGEQYKPIEPGEEVKIRERETSWSKIIKNTPILNKIFSGNLFKEFTIHNGEEIPVIYVSHSIE